MKPVLQVDKSGSFIMEYNGVREASRITELITGLFSLLHPQS